MKKFLQLFFSIFLFTSVFAATVPQQYDPRPVIKNANSINKAQTVSSTNKLSFVKRIQQKIVEKRLKKYFSKLENGNSNTETLSTLALIFGAIAVVTIFISNVAIIGVILGPAALILGIIALSRDNASKSAKTKALLGVIFGGIAVAFILLALAFIAAWSW